MHQKHILFTFIFVRHTQRILFYINIRIAFTTSEEDASTQTLAELTFEELLELGAWVLKDKAFQVLDTQGIGCCGIGGGALIGGSQPRGGGGPTQPGTQPGSGGGGAFTSRC